MQQSRRGVAQCRCPNWQPLVRALEAVALRCPVLACAVVFLLRLIQAPRRREQRRAMLFEFQMNTLPARQDLELINYQKSSRFEPRK